MAENSVLLRTTTIGLDEYNRLREQAESKDRTIGMLEQEVQDLRNKISETEQKDEESKPLVKVVHYNQRYNPYDEEEWQEHCGVEYRNLSDVKTMIKESLKKETENKIELQEVLIKSLRKDIETVQDRVDVKERQLAKAKGKYLEQVEDLKEEQSAREKET
jgi:hypothetical protein